LQFYPFVNQHISKEYMIRYKRWLPRMGFYERRLGHRFFLEESLHIIHISFILRDPKIIASWLRAMILRISFWKTRSIFRFLKYLFHNYFIHVFDDIKIKGLKIRLKGKISAAGNSRKRTILYRIGKTSHSEVNLRVVKDFSLVNTFTGVMGFQVYLFY
jgi:ribosomal protein S3